MGGNKFMCSVRYIAGAQGKPAKFTLVEKYEILEILRAYLSSL